MSRQAHAAPVGCVFLALPPSPARRLVSRRQRISWNMGKAPLRAAWGDSTGKRCLCSGLFCSLDEGALGKACYKGDGWDSPFFQVGDW